MGPQLPWVSECCSFVSITICFYGLLFVIVEVFSLFTYIFDVEFASYPEQSNPHFPSNGFWEPNFWQNNFLENSFDFWVCCKCDAAKRHVRYRRFKTFLKFEVRCVNIFRCDSFLHSHCSIAIVFFVILNFMNMCNNKCVCCSCQGSFGYCYSGWQL